MNTGSFTVLLDSCVLHGTHVRDIMLRLAAAELFRPKWSDGIEEEVRRSLTSKLSINSSNIDRLFEKMNESFPDAKVINTDILKPIEGFRDKDDLHVLGAALISRSDTIITFNMRDFKDVHLKRFDLAAKHPDDFLIDTLGLDLTKSLSAIRKARQSRKNPPMSEDDFIYWSRKCGLTSFAEKLETYKALM